MTTTHFLQLAELAYRTVCPRNLIRMDAITQEGTRIQRSGKQQVCNVHTSNDTFRYTETVFLLAKQ
jgi:hypothetical protein